MALDERICQPGNVFRTNLACIKSDQNKTKEECNSGKWLAIPKCRTISLATPFLRLDLRATSQFMFSHSFDFPISLPTPSK
jgi:hypothetical protein